MPGPDHHRKRVQITDFGKEFHHLVLSDENICLWTVAGTEAYSDASFLLSKDVFGEPGQ